MIPAESLHPLDCQCPLHAKPQGIWVLTLGERSEGYGIEGIFATREAGDAAFEAAKAKIYCYPGRHESEGGGKFGRWYHSGCDILSLDWHEVK